MIQFAIKIPGSRWGNQNLSQWRPSTKLQMETHCKYWDSLKSLLNGMAKLEAYSVDLKVVVTKVPQLNLDGRQAMVELGLTDLTGHFIQNPEGPKKLSVEQLTTELTVGSSQKACKRCCQEFPDSSKPELGCLKDFELEVKFKPEARLIFCKPRTVPLAILEDLDGDYKDGIRKQVWKPTDFNAFGTTVVPVQGRRKQL